MNALAMTRRAAALALTACLAACGGGGGGGDVFGGGGNGGGGGGVDGGGGGNGGGNGGGGGGTTPPPLVTGQYIAQPSASGAALLAAMNDQGSRGYAYLSAMVTGSAQNDFYVTDTAHSSSRLTYETVAQADSGDGLVAQLNQQGARGFAFKGPYMSGDGPGISLLTVRDAARGATYSYERQAISGSLGSDAFQAQLNAEGARGYRLVGPIGAGQDSFNLYAKDSSATTYSYTVIPVSGSGGMASGDALRQRLNEQGAQGGFYLGAFSLQGGAIGQVFEKSSAQSGAVEYDLSAVSLQQTADQKLAAMNQRAAQGFFFVSDLSTDDSSTYTLSARNAASLRSPLVGVAFPN